MTRSIRPLPLATLLLLPSAWAADAPPPPASTTPPVGASQPATPPAPPPKRPGYRAVVRNGQPMYCRLEARTGAILKQEVCRSGEQLDAEQAKADELGERRHQQGGNGGSTMFR